MIKRNCPGREVDVVSRILVVNDSRFEALILKDTLTTMDYDVKTTDDRNAITVIDSFQPDIIIANRTMGSIRGEELILQIKRKSPAITCLISSCSVIPEEDTTMIHIDGFFQTPIPREALAEVLSKAVNRRMTHENPAAKISTLLSPVTPTAAELSATPPIEPEKPAVAPAAEGHHYAFCPFCGKALSEQHAHYVFCPFCGQRLAV